jgi:hypothetical protein
MPTLRAILVNAYTRSVTEVMIEGGIEPIYTELSKDADNPVHCFTCVDIEEDKDGITQTIFVDDNGLFTQTQFIKFKGYPHPLAGNALILGTDMEDGESVSTSLLIDEVHGMVQFMSLLEVRTNCVEQGW